MNLKEWMAQVAPGVSVNAAARATQMSQTTLNAQANGSTTLKPDTVIALARQYQANPVAALVETGFLTSEEAVGVTADELRRQIKAELEAATLASMDEQQLTAEARRILAEIDRRFAKAEGRSKP